MSVEDIPDAPWIRQTQNEGAPAADDWYCPVCHAENPDWFFRYRGDTDILGCENCIDMIEPEDVLDEL